MIEEKVKNEHEADEKDRKMRELQQKISNLKSELESSDALSIKRDTQMNSLIQKIKTQDQEISKLKAELLKKSLALNSVHGELVELRPSKEALTLVEKYSKQIDDLKKAVVDRDSEINMMKSLIKTWQNQFVNNLERSPNRFPHVKVARSTIMKYSYLTNSNSTSKSVRYTDGGKTNGLEHDESFSMLQNIAEKANDSENLMKNSQEIEKLKRKEEKKKKKIEEERIQQEKIKEENERKIMMREEQIKREEDERIKKEIEKKIEEEREKKQAEEEAKKKKAEEEGKKGKSKSPVKQPAKVVGKKK